MPSCSPTASPAPSPISSVSAARQLLARLALPEPWQGTLEASLRLIDELDREIGDCERELRRLGADHRYLPLLCTVPGISWVLADTIAAELGDIDRFPTPRKLAGYTGLCPRVYQSGERALRGPLAKQGSALRTGFGDRTSGSEGASGAHEVAGVARVLSNENARYSLAEVEHRPLEQL